MYYKNTATGEKQWHHPSEADDEPPLPLPAGWEEHDHEGTTYYKNTATGEKQWHHPSEADDEPPLPLPAGWEEHDHEGTTYYKNTATGGKQWHHPSDVATEVATAIPSANTEARDGASEEIPAPRRRRPAKRASTHTKTVSAEGHTYYTDVVTLEATWEHPGEHAVIAESGASE